MCVRMLLLCSRRRIFRAEEPLLRAQSSACARRSRLLSRSSMICVQQVSRHFLHLQCASSTLLPKLGAGPHCMVVQSSCRYAVLPMAVAPGGQASTRIAANGFNRPAEERHQHPDDAGSLANWQRVLPAGECQVKPSYRKATYRDVLVTSWLWSHTCGRTSHDAPH